MIKVKHQNSTELLWNIVNDFISILKQNNTKTDLYQQTCEFIHTNLNKLLSVSIRITVANRKYTSSIFIETPLVLKHPFTISDNNDGIIELFLQLNKSNKNENELINALDNFLNIIASLISGFIAKDQLLKLRVEYDERQKELKSINQIAEMLHTSNNLDDALQKICNSLPEAFQHPKYTSALISYENKIFKSKKFKESPDCIYQTFETPNAKAGCIKIFYFNKSESNDTNHFLVEEQSLIDNLSALISGTASKESLSELLLFNTERLKELKGINATSEILSRHKSLEEALPEICTSLPHSWQYPEYTAVKIIYGEKSYQSRQFTDTDWKLEQQFYVSGRKKGIIQVFYLESMPEADLGPFLKEEQQLLVNIANLIVGMATKDTFKKLHRQNIERVKELNAINQTSLIIEQGKPIGETLQEICSILPHSWQHPKSAVARIQFEGSIYLSSGFKETQWVQREQFVTIDNKKGSIEVFYLKDHNTELEGPFLKEERKLLINIGKLISGYLNSFKGREIIHKKVIVSDQVHKPEEFRKSLTKNRKPLQLYFNQQIIDKYIYLDMMKYKIKHILFVATLYDAFILENEDSFFEKFMGEIYQYSLFSLPRITGVSSTEEALELLETTKFDLVVLMVGIDREAPINLSEKIKAKNDSLPIYLLLNKKNDIKYFEELVPNIPSVDKIFVWNGDSLILFAIVKSIEDMVNVENDTQIGLVRVILLIEDSPLYYSKYLQILYSIVFGQVQNLLPEVEKNELNKIAKMRSRPKVLHAQNYEEAITIFNKYKDYLLCVISDIEFDYGGKPNKKAGIKLIEYIKSKISTLPVILQSSEDANAEIANQLGTFFINKNSESLMNDLKQYLIKYLGFGDFVFRDKAGNTIGVAKSLREFELLLKEVPAESFCLHAYENQYSIWLMARGEIQLARTLNPMRLNSSDDIQKSRLQLLTAIKEYKDEKKKGKVLSYDETSTIDERNIISFTGGSFGGKGRGLAFIDTLIYNLDLSTLSKRINLITPITVIIGTNEFQNFITKNSLFDKIVDPSISYKELRKLFIKGKLSASLIEKLKVFVYQLEKPIVVRSSSSSEDSINQPFAGVFDTYIVPNGCSNKKESLKLVIDAIKLVFASVYSDTARSYFKAIHHKIEDETMAVVIQELVGSKFGDFYYPHISGVAQSFNYYPVSHMKPEEGFAVAGLGLGTYVVNGWKSYRFSPQYPKVSMYTINDLLNNTQVQFYALKCNIKNVDFLNNGELAALELLDIEEAEKYGALKHIASVYNPDNDSIQPGIDNNGSRILNFANVLLYDYFPLAETIKLILNTVKEAFGSPVEIEYAVNLNPGLNGLPSFYLLQIKPLVGSQIALSTKIEELKKSDMLLYTISSLGNGIVSDITDVIYIDNDSFCKLSTLEMANEIEYLNKLMVSENKQYVLIGPGRWGSSDRFLGIPVDWSQISNAKVIVEISLENYPLDFSLGSHFFHNITSMNIGYFAVQKNSTTEFIKWELLSTQKIIRQTKFFKQIRFSEPLTIIMDGRKKESAIIHHLKMDK